MLSSHESDAVGGAAGSANQTLRRAIEHAAHLLPAQGPIAVFVHHNTLHAYQQVDFEKAVAIGAKTFGCHPYLTEDQYHREVVRGRIRAEDLASELIDDLDDHADRLLGFLGTRYHLRLAMLEQPMRLAPTRELDWLITESDALRRFRDEVSPATRRKLIDRTRRWFQDDLAAGGFDDQPTRVREAFEPLLPMLRDSRMPEWSDAMWTRVVLQLSWRACLLGVRDAAPPIAAPATPVRHRDLLLDATGEDSDALVHELLIRYCGAFCDQGLAAWAFPARSEGFLRGFIELYGRSRVWVADPWLGGLRSELEECSRCEGAVDSIRRSLEILGVDETGYEAYVTHALLALRGWAGMIWQMESRGDRVPLAAPPGSLVEFLAVRLLLDRLAVAFVAKESLGWNGSLRDLRNHLVRRTPPQPALSAEQRAFQIFQLAQLRGWRPEVLCRLPADQWTALIAEVESFSSIERRRIFHRAYERRYRIEALDALAAHNAARRLSEREPPAEQGLPPFQIITCIDDREESLRRHLEEIEPACETFGAAGFFAVAMYYRGVADAHDTPLCPIVITPRHYVREHVAFTFEDSERVRRQTRQAIGTMAHRVHVASRTFTGGLVAAVLGSLASLPLVMRILFPRTTAQLRMWFGRFVEPPPVTQLELERTEPEPGNSPGHVGFTVEEMVDIVERLVRDLGLTARFARIVLVLGHGSSSQNNPHESAYNCGACAGGRGGPNARAFAQMANDPRVRSRLASRGIVIPDATHFVGGYHDTCDDGIRVYDLERIPSTHTADFTRLKAVVLEARRRNAHERCRRFYSADVTISDDAALRHVEARAEDLSQARPEYNHATNAMCIVGRRSTSRGLFLDRRAFLHSYDPTQDDDASTVLTRILQAVMPVCAGISLEYYFSCVDPDGWGAGNKLPHNIASLVGVMDGAASDLRPGLHRQMVEIHEPMRLLFVIETTAAAMRQIIDRNPGIASLVRGRWVQLALVDPETGSVSIYRDDQFQAYTPERTDLPEAPTSLAWYHGHRGNVGFARIGSTSPLRAGAAT